MNMLQLQLLRRSLVASSSASRGFSVAAGATMASVENRAVLNAHPRDIKEQGSHNSRRLRSQGFVTGVIYGIDASRKVVKHGVKLERKIIEAEVRKHTRSFENVLYDIALGSVKYTVTPRQITFHPVTFEPVNVNFLVYWPGNRLRVPIDFINHDSCVELKRGGCILIQVNQFIEVICKGEIPRNLTFDLSNSQKGDVVRLKDLVFPPGCSPSASVDPNFVVGVLRSSRK